MKHNRYQGGSSAGESSEDERVFHPPVEEEVSEYGNGGGVEEDDDWDVFENSQDLTQVLPQRPTKAASKSPKKKKKKKEKHHNQEEVELEEEVSFKVPSPSKTSPKRKGVNGFRVREVDDSEFPESFISNLKRILPNLSDCTEGLTAEDTVKAATSSKGGVCIFQCPQNISLSDLLTGKKLLLDEGRFVLEDEDEDDPELTQYAGADSLGKNVKSRRLEAVSLTDGPYMGGITLAIPESNSFKFVSAPVDRHLIIRESVEELTLPKIKIKRSKPRELPLGIKERHPVYGADFTDIIQKMEAASESPSKKKRKSRASDDNSTITGPNYWKSINQNGFLDNSSDYVPYNNDKEILAQEEITSSKKKKKKKNKHSEMEEPAFEETVNGNGDSWMTTDNSYEDAEEHEAEKRGKKSKKYKRKEVDNSLDVNETEILLDSNDAVVKKRKKSKHRE